LSVVALAILRVAVRVGPLGIAKFLVLAGLPVHVDLLQLLEVLVLPNVESLVGDP